MSTYSATKTDCPHCGAPLDVADNFCRQCGVATRSNSTGVTPGLRRPTKKSRFSETRLGILCMLFVVLGPVALPFLFKSKIFSRKEKIALTALVVAVTALVVYLLWYTVTLFLDALAEVGVA